MLTDGNLEFGISGMFCPACGTLQLPVDSSTCRCGHKRVWVHVMAGMTPAIIANVAMLMEIEGGAEIAWCVCHGTDPLIAEDPRGG